MSNKQQELKLSITEAGRAAALNNVPDRNGFRIELTHADIYSKGAKKARIGVVGVNMGGKQVRVRGEIKSETEEYSYDEVRFIDRSGVDFCILKRKDVDGGVLDFVAPHKLSVLSYNLIFDTLADSQVTIVADTNVALWNEFTDFKQAIEEKIKNLNPSTSFNDIEDKPTTLDGYGITDGVSDSELVAEIAKLKELIKKSTVPTGTISSYGGLTAPAGWLFCDGALYQASEYPELYHVIGANFTPTSERSGYFNVPDLRGEFVRGWDNGRGVDVGRGFGTAQEDRFKTHRHSVQWNTFNEGGVENNRIASGGHSVAEAVFNGDTTDTGGSTETRPRNIAVNFIIKT